MKAAMADFRDDLDLCGWRVRSAIAIPELRQWQGADRAPDIEIEIGDVPALASPILKTPMAEVDASGRVKFGVQGVVDYLVEEGRRIRIDSAVPLDAPEVRLFLLGSGLGFLCHQRGLLPLHAATVDIDGEAILLAGASGAGKSTLAAAFLRHGYPVLSDDVSPLDLSGETPLILPSVERLRLWSDSVAHARWHEDELERCRAGLEKFALRVAPNQSIRPLPPRAIFYLRRQSDPSGGSSFQRMRGAVAAEEFQRQIYRWRTLTTMVGEGTARVRCALAAACIARHYVLERPLRFDDLDRTVDDIVATVRASR
jgi:hypothetical protein